MAGEIAKYGIQVDSNAGEAASDAAVSIGQLRDSIKGGQDRIKDLSSSLRNLRGSSDEVKEAKIGLKAQLDATRNSISQSELGLRKLGTSTGQLANIDRKRAQAGAASTTAMKSAGDAIKQAGGPVGALKGKLDSLKESLSGPGGTAFAMAGIAGAAIAAGSAAIEFAGKISDLAVDAAKFIFVSANMARASQINRESLLGNARDATALGSQIDRLADKLPKTKEQLNEMSLSLIKGGLSGKALVDSLEAVAGAGDDDLGNKIKGIVEAGKLTKRIQLGKNDLIGSGLNFDDVAAELSKSMGVGMAQARRALQSGTVGLATGAEALKNAVNKKFGGINARKMLDLNTIAVKFKASLVSLADKVNIEPLLKGLVSITDLFKDSTVSGAALKELVTAAGKELVLGFQIAAPIAKVLFKGLIIAALDLGTQYYILKKQLQDVFGKDAISGPESLRTEVVLLQMTLDLLTFPLRAIQADLKGIGVAAKQFGALRDAAQNAYDLVNLVGWKQLGSNVVDGFVEGIKGGLDGVKGALGNLGDTAKNALKKSLGIASPSKVMRELGGYTGDGFTAGIEDSHDDAHDAIRKLGNAAPASSASASGGGGMAGAGGSAGGVNMPISITVNGADKATSQALQSPAYLAGLVAQIIENAAIGGGLLQAA